ncbi:MAG TPA: DUF2225 domain-containing protein [Bacillus bacterium]|nr:DUF2225 domain-containing protein [Bacillus sp. (in: firmicutes)]
MSNEQLTPLYDKKETCPLCQTAFTSKKIRSRFVKVDHTDSDFCPYYHDETISPLLYFVKVCPSCGYSYTDQYQTYFFEGTKEEIINSVSMKWVPHDFGGERTIHQAIQTYKLAFYCATLKKEKAIVIASILLRLTWLYRRMGNEKEEERFMELTLEQLNGAYLDAYYGNTDLTEIRVLYLIGELNKRLGHYDEALTHLARVVDKQNTTLERKVVDLARQQWFATRDILKEKDADQANNSADENHTNEEAN